MEKPPRRRLLTAFLALIAALGVLELALRALEHPPPHPEATLDGADAGVARFEIDPVIGFRPVLDGPHYGPDGALLNSYPRERRSDVERVLFIGDSATARGRIVEAIAARVGDGVAEWWNGGVESFDLLQTVAYFRRYTIHVDPTHVVLTFHVNDYQMTPVVFTAADGRRVRYEPPPPRARLWPFAYARLRTVRHGIDALLGRRDARVHAERTAAALLDLARLCSQNDIRLTVLVLPALAPRVEWTAHQERWHNQALAACAAAGVRHIDLNLPLSAALSAGIDVQEAPADWAHPSQAAADFIAAHLVAAGVF